VTDEQDPGQTTEPMDPKDWPVLFVDDDDASLEAFQRSFGGEFTVAVARTGDEALEALQRDDFAVIISDQRMPGMTGVELLMRTLSDSPDLQRFLLTEYSDPKVVMDGMNRARIDQYVTKPWDESALRVALRRAIEVRASLLQTRAQMARLRAQNVALGQKVRERTREIGEIAERQRRLSVIDGVTGLHNHRHFRERWRGEVRRSRRYGQTLTLMQIEIDGVADMADIDQQLYARLLRDLAILLRSSVRDVDEVARFGTREFSILLPETPRESGALLARRLSAAVAERKVSHPRGGDVSVSIGVGGFPEDGPTSSEVLHRTRSAMKRSRDSGGNQVFVVLEADQGLADTDDGPPNSEEALAALVDLSGEFSTKTE